MIRYDGTDPMDMAVKNMIDSLDVYEAVENSYCNLHVGGLHYVNLLRTDRFTVKLYIFDNPDHNEVGWLVWPHNHAYNFHHHTLVGTIHHTRFNMVPASTKGAEKKKYDIHTYDTPLNGGKGLVNTGVSTGLLGSVEKIPAGHSYYLDASEIHTICTEDDYSAAVLFQYHDIVPGRPTLMYAPHDVDACCEGSGLYQKMSTEQACGLVKDFSTRWEGQFDG
jgi:hypothetical protein